MRDNHRTFRTRGSEEDHYSRDDLWEDAFFPEIFCMKKFSELPDIPSIYGRINWEKADQMIL